MRPIRLTAMTMMMMTRIETGNAASSHRRIFDRS
jgi:hypothetical protein